MELYDPAKRLLDLIVSSVVLVLFSPLFAIIAALVKITSAGPVLFRQDRVGRAGALFTIYKFRSMFEQAPSCTYIPPAPHRIRASLRLGRFLRQHQPGRISAIPQCVSGTNVAGRAATRDAIHRRAVQPQAAAAVVGETRYHWPVADQPAPWMPDSPSFGIFIFITSLIIRAFCGVSGCNWRAFTNPP